MDRLPKIPFSLFLLSIYMPVAMFANNLGMVVTSALARPLVASLLIGAILTLGALLLFRNVRKATVFTSLALILFFVFEPLREQALKLNVFGVNPGYYRYFLPLLVVVMAGAAIWLFRTRSNMATAMLLVNVVALSLYIMPVFQIANFNLRYASMFFRVGLSFGAQQSQGITARQTEDSRTSGEKPDIYLIVLDMYGRADKIQAEFGFDNRLFLEQLRSTGFYVASCATSNYSHTVLSIASVLNFNYLEEMNGGHLPEDASYDWLNTAISQSKARQELARVGYRMVTFENGFPFINIADGDVYLKNTKADPVETDLNGFELLWLEQTPFRILLKKENIRKIVFAESEAGIRKFGYQFNQTRSTLIQLREVPSSVAGPKFVYAHIVLPHPPYIFTPDGSYTEESRFNDGPNHAPIDQESYKLGYMNQLKYVNSQIIPIVQKIIHDSPTPPIIILMGDHGFWGEERSRLPILNAYYLPGLDYDQVLYPGITPANTFRVILNEYLGADYPLVEDRSFYSPNDSNFFELREYNGREADCIPW